MRYGSIRPWEPEIYSDLILIVSLDDSSWSGCYELLNTISYLPSPSSSQSSSQSSVSGVFPLVGCEKRDLQHVRSAFPPASQPPSVCSRHWCSPCDTYGRFSSPAGPRGQRLKFNNNQLISREVQQLLVWAKHFHPPTWHKSILLSFPETFFGYIKPKSTNWNVSRQNINAYISLSYTLICI